MHLRKWTGHKAQAWKYAYHTTRVSREDNIDLKSRPYEMALLCYSSEGQ